MKLDPESAAPLYQQLQGILRTQIARKIWGVGGKLPSEHELCRQYGVTRPTVRQALECLVREGWVAKQRGKGAFVTEAPAPVGLFNITGTSDAFAAQKAKVETKVLRVQPVNSCLLADGADPAGGWIKLERVRRVNGVPTFYELAWLHAAVVPGLEKVNLTDLSLYRTLAEKYALRVDGGRQRFSAVPASEKAAKVLDIRPGEPLLRVVRHMNLKSDRPAESAQNGRRLPGALRVDLYAASGPFVLEQSIPAHDQEPEGACTASC